MPSARTDNLSLIFYEFEHVMFRVNELIRDFKAR